MGTPNMHLKNGYSGGRFNFYLL